VRRSLISGTLVALIIVTIEAALYYLIAQYFERHAQFLDVARYLLYRCAGIVILLTGQFLIFAGFVRTVEPATDLGKFLEGKDNDEWSNAAHGSTWLRYFIVLFWMLIIDNGGR
jgi:hypothetical protein